MKILVVDDFEVMRRIIRNLLKQIGDHTIEEAEDGVQALRRIKLSNFDLIITDWNMPNMSGYELLKEIRMDQRTSQIPVVMVTAEAKREQIVAAANAGVNGYIVKPFNLQQLNEKINRVFSRIN